MPLLLSASEELKKQVLPAVAAGDAMVSYALSGAGRPDPTRLRCVRGAILRGDHWVLNGTKSWITNAGGVHVLHRDGCHRAWGRSSGVSSAFVGAQGRSRFLCGTEETKLGIRGSPTSARDLLRGLRRSPPIGSSASLVPASRHRPLRTLDHTRLTIGAQALGIAQAPLAASAYVTQRKHVRTADRRSSRACNSCWPIWRYDRGRPPVDLRGGGQGRAGEPDLTWASAAAKVSRFRHRHGGDDRRRAAARRLRASRGTSRSSA